MNLKKKKEKKIESRPRFIRLYSHSQYIVHNGEIVGEKCYPTWFCRGRSFFDFQYVRTRLTHLNAVDPRGTDRATLSYPLFETANLINTPKERKKFSYLICYPSDPCTRAPDLSLWLSFWPRSGKTKTKPRSRFYSMLSNIVIKQKDFKNSYSINKFHIYIYFYLTIIETTSNG